MAKKSIKVSKKKVPKKEVKQSEPEIKDRGKRKPGTWYDKNRPQTRKLQNQYKKDVKSGKRTPKKRAPKAPRAKGQPKVKQTIEERRVYDAQWKREKRKKDQQAFRDFFKANYPTEDE